MDKELKDKAISIKGKAYVLVSDRVIYFNECYPNGNIVTELLSSYESDMVVMRATVVPDVENPNRYFTGFSQATWGDGIVNKTSALENAETSAVGRALAFMGIGVIDSIASADEMGKAGVSRHGDSSSSNMPRLNGSTEGGSSPRKATEAQIKYLQSLIVNSGQLPDNWLHDKGLSGWNFTSEEAHNFIEELK